jgi:hypothetical protein
MGPHIVKLHDEMQSSPSLAPHRLPLIHTQKCTRSALKLSPNIHPTIHPSIHPSIHHIQTNTPHISPWPCAAGCCSRCVCLLLPPPPPPHVPPAPPPPAGYDPPGSAPPIETWRPAPPQPPLQPVPAARPPPAAAPVTQQQAVHELMDVCCKLGRSLTSCSPCL